MRWQFLIPGLVALAMLALLLRLGFWQLSRAEYKEQLEQRSQENSDQIALSLNRGLPESLPSAWLYRRATAMGRFDGSREFLLDNRTYNGQAGYHLLTPLDLGREMVLVNRGWVPVGARREQLPTTQPLSPSMSSVVGVLRTPPRSGLILGSTGHEAKGEWPRVVQTVDLPAMARSLEHPLLPAILLLDGGHPACHVCDWKPVPGMGAQKHRGYAFQWFALALTLVLLCAIVARRYLRRDS